MCENFDPNAPYDDRVKQLLEMARDLLAWYRRKFKKEINPPFPHPFIYLKMVVKNEGYKKEFRQAVVEVLKEELSNPDEKEATAAEKVLKDLGVINPSGKQN